MHPLKNLFNRLTWDKREKPDSYLLTYTHRGAPGDVRSVKVSEIGPIGKTWFTLLEDEKGEAVTIPFHRVVEIREIHSGQIVWRSRKTRRLDS